MTISKEMLEKIALLRPIDDVLFAQLVVDIRTCQEMLQKVMKDSNLVVLTVIPQNVVRNIWGRSVILDALCRLGDGTTCCIEVQRSDNDNHVRRSVFNATSVIVKDSETGTDFSDIKDIYVVYISEFDFLKGNKTIYHIDSIIRETGDIINTGMHFVFVNTEIDDGSDIAELMSCFLQRRIHNTKFPELSKRMTYLKETKGGQTYMCEVLKEMLDESEIKSAIKAARLLNASDDRIIDMLETGYHLTRKDATYQLDLYKSDNSVSIN